MDRGAFDEEAPGAAVASGGGDTLLVTSASEASSRSATPVGWGSFGATGRVTAVAGTVMSSDGSAARAARTSGIGAGSAAAGGADGAPNAPRRRNRSYRSAIRALGDSRDSSVSWRLTAAPRRCPASCGSRWAPPRGSVMTSSTTPSSRRSCAVRRSASAARSAYAASLKRIEAQPSGEITEYIPYAIISTRLATPIASAPPLPPSPMTTVTTGTDSDAMPSSASAIACAWPRSSAPMPGYAPGVSISVTIGSEKRSAIRITRSAFR